jgi:type IV secretion system protein VirB6
VIGVWDPVGIVDQILFEGGDAAEALFEKGGIFHGHFSYDLAGLAVYLLVSLTAVYTVFLLSLSKIALSILLALGPLFIVLALFDSTRRFCEAWIAQLANYALIAILTVLVAALMMTLLTTAAQAAAATGGGVSIADAVRVCMAAGMTFLVMRQVMPIASGLASGVALSTFGLLSTAVMWGLGKTVRTGTSFGRGAIFDGLRKGGATSRWDPLSRQAGFYAGRFVRSGVAAVARRVRPNSIRPTP